MLTTLAVLASIGTTPLPPRAVLPPARPRIEAWMNRGDALYRRGEAVRVYFEADRDAFVTLLRIDTDGRVRVLFPRAPWEDNFAHGEREYEVQDLGSPAAFRIDDEPGMGYVFAIIAADPFDYSAIVSADHWDYRLIGDGRVRGDPYVALTELVERIVPAGYTDWDYDLIPYYVERHYDYPRFVCYDCHSYGWARGWDPYHRSCVQFRLVIYDDPWYYPYRYRHGTRVVVVRPYRPAPRFVFRDRDGSRFVTRVRERPVNDDRRRVIPVRERGGVDAVPAPVGPRPRPETVSPRPRPESGSEVTERRRVSVDRDRGTAPAPVRGEVDRPPVRATPSAERSDAGRRVVTPRAPTGRAVESEGSRAAPGERRTAPAQRVDEPRPAAREERRTATREEQRPEARREERRPEARREEARPPARREPELRRRPG